MAWDINKAIYALNRNAAGSAQHLCARYVRMAIEAGGISTAGRPGSAYQYQWYLPKIGFNKITQIYGREEQRAWSNSTAKTGDIAVMEHGQHGHICMWNGSRWVSDFFQNNMWVYSGNGTCYLYRYDGEINNSVVPPYTPPWQQPNASGGGGTSVYSAPSGNQLSGETASTTAFSGQSDDQTRTRIYKATNPTLMVDELSMPMVPRGADEENSSIDMTAQANAQQGEATGNESPTGAA